MSWVPPLGEDSWGPMPGFPETSPREPFPFPDFALYPFAIINYSHEHNYTLTPVILPSESSNPGMLLGILDSVVYWQWQPSSTGDNAIKASQTMI